MQRPWFEEGLKFSCRRCGDCCTGDPGYVYLKRGEARVMADFLEMPLGEFRSRYTRKVGGRTSLVEQEDGRCCFLGEGGCRLYDSRPVQCRTFPFWLWIVAKPESWDEAARECPGMNRGRRFSRQEIEELLALRVR